jgi:predicted membrane-bound mannosyltransferase
MYAYIWRRLPGPWQVKSVIAAAIVIAIVFVLFYWGFPWFEQTFGFGDVAVR